MHIPQLDDHPGVAVTAAGVEGLDAISADIDRLQNMLYDPLPASPLQLFANDYSIKRAVRKIHRRAVALRLAGDTVGAAELETHDAYLTLTGCYCACRQHYDLAYGDALALRAAFDQACASYMQRVKAAPDADDEHLAWVHTAVVPRLTHAAHEDALDCRWAQHARPDTADTVSELSILR